MPEKDKILRPSLNIRPVSPFTDPAEPTDSPESRLNAFNARQAKERYERAYKEYEDTHPVGILDWIGYDPRETGLTNHPYARQSHAAHKYAMEKTASDLEEKNLISDWSPTYLHNPIDPIEDWKEGEKLQTGAAVSAATFPAMIAASTGALGTFPKILADIKFGYDGVTGLASPEGAQKTWDFIKQGRYARAIPSAAWDALDLVLAIQGLKGLSQFGKYGSDIIHATKHNLLNGGPKALYPWQYEVYHGPTIRLEKAYTSPVTEVLKKSYTRPTVLWALEHAPKELPSVPINSGKKAIAFASAPTAVQFQESYRIPNGSAGAVSEYEQMFMDWYRQNVKEPNVTVDHLKQFVDQLPDQGHEVFKRNFRENIDDLVKDDTYHKALGTGDIVKEFRLMGMPDRDPVYVDEQDILDFYRTDALPRVLKNIEAAGFKLTPKQVEDITEIYSNPFMGVDSKIRYTVPGVGGFSRGDDVIGYSNRYHDALMDQPTSFIDSGTTVHELHHRLRSKLGNYLKSQGIILNPDIPADPNNPFSLRRWQPPKKLRNTSADIMEYVIRNRTPQIQYTPQEIKLMEPLAMLQEYNVDKTPIAEIGAVSAGNARFKAWQLAKKQLPEGRILPTIEETDSSVKSLIDQGTGWYRSLPYGYQIGSLGDKTYNDTYNALMRRDALYGRIARDRYKKLPLYKKIFIKPPQMRYGVFDDQYLPDTQKKATELFMKHDRDLKEVIRKAITGIGVFGTPMAIGLNNIPQEKE